MIHVCSVDLDAPLIRPPGSRLARDSVAWHVRELRILSGKRNGLVRGEINFGGDKVRCRVP